jgi:hypothetical protein
MRFSSLRTTFRALARLGINPVIEDAEALIRDFGPAALDEAEARSSREDIGLLPTRNPGHWSRVAREIARRSGRAVTAPVLERAA